MNRTDNIKHSDKDFQLTTFSNLFLVMNVTPSKSCTCTFKAYSKTFGTNNKPRYTKTSYKWLHGKTR